MGLIELGQRKADRAFEVAAMKHTLVGMQT